MISSKILRAAVVLASAAVSPLGTLAQANDITYVTVSEVSLADDSTKVADMAALHNNREVCMRWGPCLWPRADDVLMITALTLTNDLRPCMSP